MKHKRSAWAVAILMVAPLLLALGLGALRVQCGEWEQQNPLPTGNQLFDVWGSSGSDVFVVGLDGTILHYGSCHWLPRPLIVRNG